MENIEQGHKEFVKRLEHICNKYSDKTAITYIRNDDSKTLFTFGDIFKSIRSAKEKFNDIGLCPGDRVAIIAPHSPFAIMAGLSLAYSNITSVLIDASLPAEEINRLLEQSDVRATLATSDIYGGFEKALKADIPMFNIMTIADGFTVFSDSISSVKRDATKDPHLDVIAILYSSGTTASVKGIMVTYQTVIKALKLYMINTGLTADMTYLLVLPFSHVAGYSNSCQYLLTGCEIGMIEDVDASKLSKGLNDYQPVIFSMVPRVFEVIESKIRQEIRSKGEKTEKKVLRLLSLSGFMRKKLGINIGKKLFNSITDKVFGTNIYGLGTGATPVKKANAEFFLNMGLEWANIYALTETYVPCVGTGIHDRYPAGTEGYVKRHPGIDIKIHTPDKDGIGEIRIKTVLIMKGYFRDPELTAAAFDEDGYFKTGDLGYIDKKDYLHVTGRIKEAIIMHTGKKVAPTDVDSFYSGLMGDLVFASCGVPNRDGTYDEIHLFIEKGELSIDEQKELCNQIMDLSGQTSTLYQLAGLHFINTIPMTSIKKVKRFQLRDIALSIYNDK
ncbi:MAG: acyl--CoA ligase [Oscillospiraceae bacterium]|jgi:long-chain acyl-CoA synthetase|nr:acyl--CoA ligase [Oscillospiraceae bacterium]